MAGENWFQTPQAPPPDPTLSSQAIGGAERVLPPGSPIPGDPDPVGVAAAQAAQQAAWRADQGWLSFLKSPMAPMFILGLTSAGLSAAGGRKRGGAAAAANAIQSFMPILMMASMYGGGGMGGGGMSSSTPR